MKGCKQLWIKLKREVTILMGGFNAKVGFNNTGYESIMGKHGLGQMNQNREMFAENNIAIGGSQFPHKQKHKVTWMSPDQVTENQIDHIGISRKFRRSMLDVRAKRGVDAASDHHLIVTKQILELKMYRTSTSARIKCNVYLLRDKAFAEAFQITLSNRYQVLADMHEENDQENTENVEDIESYWHTIKQMWTKSCEEVVGKRKRQHKPWITTETLKKIEERKSRKDLNRSRTRAEKALAQQQY